MTKPKTTKVTPLNEGPGINQDGMTTGEVAAFFRVRRETVSRWDRTGKLKAIYVTPGGQRRFSRRIVESFLIADDSDS